LGSAIGLRPRTKGLSSPPPSHPISSCGISRTVALQLAFEPLQFSHHLQIGYLLILERIQGTRRPIRTLSARLMAHQSASVNTAEAHRRKCLVSFLNQDFDNTSVVTQRSVSFVDVLCELRVP
jgi:hypothetical protein